MQTLLNHKGHHLAMYLLLAFLIPPKRTNRWIPLLHIIIIIIHSFCAFVSQFASDQSRIDHTRSGLWVSLQCFQLDCIMPGILFLLFLSFSLCFFFLFLFCMLFAHLVIEAVVFSDSSLHIWLGLPLLFNRTHPTHWSLLYFYCIRFLTTDVTYSGSFRCPGFCEQPASNGTWRRPLSWPPVCPGRQGYGKKKKNDVGPDDSWTTNGQANQLWTRTAHSLPTSA